MDFRNLTLTKILIFVRLTRLIFLGGGPIYYIVNMVIPMFGLVLSIPTEVWSIIKLVSYIGFAVVNVIQYPLTVMCTREIEEFRSYIDSTVPLKLRSRHLHRFRNSLFTMHKICRRNLWWIIPGAFLPQVICTMIFVIKYLRISDEIKKGRYLVVDPQEEEVDAE